MADALQINDPESLRNWLKDKPVDWSRLVALRAALRVFPLVPQSGRRASGLDGTGFQRLTLAVWRCLLISSVARKYPTDEMRTASARAASAAARAAARAAASAYAAARAAARAASSDSSAAAASRASRAASSASSASSSWDAIRCDCAILARDGPNGLETAPLWLEHDHVNDPEHDPEPVIATPKWAGAATVRLADHLITLLGPEAEVIGDWYRPLLSGDANASWSRMFLGDRARKLALRKDDFWKVTEERPGEAITEDIAAALAWVRPDPQEVDPQPRDLGSVSELIIRYIESEPDPVSIDMIRARFDRENHTYVDSTLRRELGTLAREGQIQRVRRGWYAGANYFDERRDVAQEPPQPVEQGSGPKFGASKGRLDRFPSPPLAGEEADPTLAKLHARIKRRLNALRQAFRNDLARYPQLAETLTDYEDAIRPEIIGDLDIDELWMSGAGLIAQARAFAALDPSKQVTEPLEPQQQALLGEIARLHGALIMGFAKGRDLAEKSGLPLLTPEEFRALLEHERIIVRWLLEADRYDLSDQARGFLESVDHTLLSASEGAEQLAILGYPTVRNLLIFSANALGSVERLAGRLSLAGVPVNLAVTGMLYFFRDNLGPILAFASSIPELRSYLEYHLVRLEIDWQERNAGKDDDWKT